ncbi:c-type cytochrome [Marinomonas sp. PE14-40]|uniref:c-type cytochrome n=1 Tax=Marinomonas sp. PE14-40 TaxID=3060621 RepID=UPI003F678B47
MKKMIPLIISLAFISTSTQVSAARDIQNGAQKYQTNCLVCHGVKGLGDGPAASTLAKKPSNLVKKLNSIFIPKMMLSKIVLKGKVDQGMPAWEGILSKQDTYDIFAYLESIQ